MTTEFDLIRQCFSHATAHTDLGVGDDGALFRARPGMQMVVSTDMLVSGTHFFPDTEPEALGWKTAAVNISDMAAMAAEPRWMLLAASLPMIDELWLAAFSQGFLACCRAFNVDWVGGDTTRGPLNLSATVIGEVPSGQAILRSGAATGDDIWISGIPGLAALGLKHLQGRARLGSDWLEPCLNALQRPQPRVALGTALRGVASAMLDVSDGLLGDLRHILESSRCGALIDDARLPLLPVFAACDDAQLARTALLGGGDDYELLFTAVPAQRTTLEALSKTLSLPLTRIGSTTNEPEVIWLIARDGKRERIAAMGFDHFGNA